LSGGIVYLTFRLAFILHKTRCTKSRDTAHIEAGVLADALRFDRLIRPVFFHSVGIAFSVASKKHPTTSSAIYVGVDIARVGQGNDGAADGCACLGDIAGFELLGGCDGG